MAARFPREEKKGRPSASAVVAGAAGSEGDGENSAPVVLDYQSPLAGLPPSASLRSSSSGAAAAASGAWWWSSSGAAPSTYAQQSRFVGSRRRDASAARMSGLAAARAEHEARQRTQATDGGGGDSSSSSSSSSSSAAAAAAAPTSAPLGADDDVAQWTQPVSEQHQQRERKAHLPADNGVAVAADAKPAFSVAVAGAAAPTAAKPAAVAGASNSSTGTPAVRRRVVAAKGAKINEMLEESLLVCHVLSCIPGREVARAARVCKDWAVLVRDSYLWRLCCAHIWRDGPHLDTYVLKYQGNWNQMYRLRPHVRYDGSYVITTAYTREVERDMDRPAKVIQVKYYRYLRFLPNGQVWYALLNDESPMKKPLSARDPRLIKGQYRASSSEIMVRVDTSRPNERGGMVLFMRMAFAEMKHGPNNEL